MIFLGNHLLSYLTRSKDIVQYPSNQAYTHRTLLHPTSMAPFPHLLLTCLQLSAAWPFTSATHLPHASDIIPSTKPQRQDPRAHLRRPLILTNNCPEAIHPGIYTRTGEGPLAHGFKLDPGETTSLLVGPDCRGQVWARTNCSFTRPTSWAEHRDEWRPGLPACDTGDCNGVMSCNVPVSPSPVTRQLSPPTPVSRPSPLTSACAASNEGRSTHHARRDLAQPLAAETSVIPHLALARLQPANGNHGRRAPLDIAYLPTQARKRDERGLHRDSQLRGAARLEPVRA